MTFFNFSVLDLNIPDKYKNLFTQQQEHVNQLLNKLDEFIKSSEHTFSLNFTLPKSLKDISGNNFNIYLYASYQGSYIKFLLHENKSVNNIDNIVNFQHLSIQLNELFKNNNLFEIYNSIVTLKKTTQKINSLLYVKKEKNLSFDSVVDFYKSFYVNENSPLLKDKKIKKYCIIKDNTNNMINFREKEAKLFLPIILPEHNSYQFDDLIMNLDSDFMENYKNELYKLNLNTLDLIPKEYFYFYTSSKYITQQNVIKTIEFSIQTINFKELAIIAEKLQIKNTLENF